MHAEGCTALRVGKEITKCYLDKMKSINKIRILIPASVGLLVVVTYFLPIHEDYRINLFTELIGVLVTVVLVDYLYRLDNAKEERENEEKKLINLDSLLSIYMDKYLENLNVMTNDKFDPERDPDKIEINDLQYLYDSAFLKLRPFFVKKYVLYFESLDKLTETIKQNIPTIDARYYPHVVYLLQTFTAANDIHYLKEMIEERTTLTYGKQPAWEKDKETLKNYEEKPKSDTENYSSNDLYKQLFQSIAVNVGIIKNYQSFMHKLRKKYGVEQNKE